MQLGRVGGETAPGESAEGTFVVGRGFLVVLPVGTDTSVVAALHALTTDPAVSIEALVSLIPLGGAEDVDSFAAIVPGERHDGDSRDADGVPHDGIPVHAVVRGAIAVDVFSIGGSRRFTDRNIRPWLLAEFQAVTGLVIGSPLAAVAREQELGSGRVLGEGIDCGDTLYWSVALRAPDAADTILRPRRLAEDTVMLARPDDGPVEATAESAPDLPGNYGFRLATGEEARLDRVYRIGRRPRPRRIRAGEVVELVVVPSPTAMVSASHLEISQIGGAVVLTDLGSTNGTLVRFALGRTQRLRSGASLTVLPGTTVDIGDGNLIEILPAG